MAEHSPSPVAEVDLASLATLIAHPSRAAMLDVLLGGRALAAGELATIAGIGRPTASEHLSQLLAGGLVTVVAQGRHRYYRLASAEVASMLESMALVAPARPPRTLRLAGQARSLQAARSCYDHLAGVAGVRLHDALFDRGWLLPARDGYELDPAGASYLLDRGLDVGALRAARRTFARPCLDWTERRPHLAGALAAGLLQHLLDQGWLLRRTTSPRALVLTPLGDRGLTDLAGHHPPPD